MEATEQVDGKLLSNFVAFARTLWRINDKQGKLVTFNPMPSQRIVLHHLADQRAHGKPGRLRVLKYRQAGMSLLWRLFVLHQVITRPGVTAISIADKLALPEQWVRGCRTLVRQITEQVEDGPELKASSAHELYFESQASRYFIGSAEGQTPGMGETIQVIHCSEVASWRNPDVILSDLIPAVPPGENTYIIQESTGRAYGDWWFQRYYESKRGENEYRAVFLPWFIQPEYKVDGETWEKLGKLSDREKLTIQSAEGYAEADGKLVGFEGVSPEQLSWRRFMLNTEFHGDEDLFANQYPATEEESFLSGGGSVFSPDQVRIARETVRKPIWTGDIVPEQSDPSKFALVEGTGGLTIWENPDERYHYVIGADVQWGTKDTADFDAAYVQCLEHNRIVARLHYRWDMGIYAGILAALGWHYRTCADGGTNLIPAILAPERNSQAASGVLAVLLGLVGNSWRYPSLWIRDSDLKLRGYKAEDYGFLTNEHTKAQIIAMAKVETLAGGYDWTDKMCVDEMTAYIRDDNGKLTAPVGAHDDCLMARMITAYVSHRVRARADLYVEKQEIAFTFDTMEDRMKRMFEEEDERT